jgi:hypothetical protein
MKKGEYGWPFGTLRNVVSDITAGSLIMRSCITTPCFIA